MWKQRFDRRLPVLALAAVVLLAGCTATPRASRLAVVPPPVAEPLPPAGASANLVIPGMDAGGNYLTLNQGLSPQATVWHVRSALNVAALGCRGTEATSLTANYNRLLADKRALLAAAFASTEADARAFTPSGWRDAHDRQMTRLYNFFAQPPAKDAFCVVASRIAMEAAATSSADFTAFAASALPQLEAPFLAFYRAYDGWRRDHAAWAAQAAPPRLAYAPLDTVMAWAPEHESARRLAAAGR